MDQGNFLKQLDGLQGLGDGFRFDRPIGIEGAFLLSDGSALTTTLTTNPGFAMAETNARVIQWAATKVVAASFRFQVPGDYDQQKDELRLRMLIQMGGATDVPGFTLNVYRKRAATAITADLGPVTAKTETSAHAPIPSAAVSTFAASNSATVAVFELSQLSMRPGDVLTFKITPAAHGTDAINLHSLAVRYRSDLVLYDTTKR